jgi:hypothetical protein
MSVDTILTIVFFALFGALLVEVFAAVNSLLNNYGKNKGISKFRSDPRQAIIDTQPTWDQVRIMASTQPITTEDVSIVVREIMTEALSASARLKPHIALIETYVQADKSDEPFEDMPQDIRIHLERLRDQLPNRPELLEALVNHLRDAKTKNVRLAKRQSLVNIISLMVGLAGLIVGIVSIIWSR